MSIARALLEDLGLDLLEQMPFLSLGNMTLDGFVGRRALLGRVSEG